jgi:aminoglycoside phosphotransferase (APT) family kinase protein
MHGDQIDSDVALARSLVAAQFPGWAALPVEEVRSTGTDNALYRLGSDLVVRLPLRPSATAPIEREHRWLPFLAAHLPLEVPVPVARGQATPAFPWPWSVVRWIDGEDATTAEFDRHRAAADVARVVTALHTLDPTGGPVPLEGTGRGVPLADRDGLTRWAIGASAARVETGPVTVAWEAALATPAWDRPGVWVHGDVASGNLLFRGGRLTALLDWGCLGVGDPACDLIVAWELFDDDARAVFRSELGVDDATWERGRGWALSTAVLELSYYRDTNPFMADRSRRQLAATLGTRA